MSVCFGEKYVRDSQKWSSAYESQAGPDAHPCPTIWWVQDHICRDKSVGVCLDLRERILKLGAWLPRVPHRCSLGVPPSLLLRKLCIWTFPWTLPFSFNPQMGLGSPKGENHWSTKFYNICEDTRLYTTVQTNRDRNVEEARSRRAFCYIAS